MRFISTDPEFSWGGTIGIVVGFGIAALGQAGAYLGRRAERNRRSLTVLRMLGVVRAYLALVASIGPMYVLVELFGDLSVVQAVAATAWFVAIYAGIIWAAGFSLGPQLDGWRSPRFVRAVGIAAMVVLPVMVALTFEP